MVINLTDEQVSRVLNLCERIAKIKQELPPPPQGFIVDEEIAKFLRKSLEERNNELLELGALLR